MDTIVVDKIKHRKITAILLKGVEKSIGEEKVISDELTTLLKSTKWGQDVLEHVGVHA